MSNKIGRNQRPCICGKDIKYKMCCDSQNTKLNYWEKDKVKKTSSNNIDTSGWKPKLEKGRINFNDEFERMINERFKTFDEFGGEKFKDIMVTDWLKKFKPYTDEFEGNQETWDETKDEWIDTFNRTHDRWRKLISENDDELILTYTSPVNISKNNIVNYDPDMNVDIKREQYPLDRNTKYYKQMLKEYDDISLDKLVLDKVKEVKGRKGGWFKKNNSIIKLRTCDVDLNNTNIWCVFNDYCYSHIEWLNKWKEELIELVPTNLIGLYIRDWYFKLGLPLNKVEMKEGIIDELTQFITKLKETTDTTWNELGMNMCYEFLHTNSVNGLDEWGGRNFCIMIHPPSYLESLQGGSDNGINTKSDNDTITIYRNVLDLDYSNGFSWSTDSSQSIKWGLSRFYVGCGKDKGYILKGEVLKKDIMGYTNHQDDKGGMNEVFVHPSKVTITKTTELNKDSIVEVMKTNSVVRKDLLQHWLSGFNIELVRMWEGICKYEYKQDTTLMRQTFLNRFTDFKEGDKKNITKSIESGTMVIKPLSKGVRPTPLGFTPQTQKDLGLIRNRKLMNQTQQKYVMVQNEILSGQM